MIILDYCAAFKYDINIVSNADMHGKQNEE